MTWDNFLIAQTHNGMYATELFIKTAAVLIGINIQITSEHCTRQHPYNIVASTWNDEETSTANLILIGNISGIHFQSLIPCESNVGYLTSEMESLSTNKHQMMILRIRKQLIQAQTSPEKPSDNDLQKQIIEPTNEFIAMTMNPDITPYYVGPMNNVCEYCNAMRFTNESLNCCHNGKVSLPELSPYPEELKDLLINDSVQAKNF